jgi:phospholipid/cholesterol/gamma-HCH transport system substrate-binding protein
MVVSADEVLHNINDVLDAKTKDNLKQSIANLTVTLESFKEISGNVNAMLSDNKTKIDQSLSNIQKASGNFSKISDSIAAANIGKTIKTVETSIAKLDGILSGVENGKGSLGKLVKDPALYENLNKTSKELELLLEDLRLNPTRYINVSVFGKKNKPYQTNKKDTLAKP